VASSLLKNVWFAAWGHAAYKISSEIGMPCRPGALTGRLFQRAPNRRDGWGRWRPRVGANGPCQWIAPTGPQPPASGLGL